MWEVLELACSNATATTTGNSLLHWSLAPVQSAKSLDEVVFEVGCALSPDVNVDTSDGGQSAPICTTSAPASASLSYPGMATPSGVQTLSSDVLADTSSTSWLWDGRPSSMSIHSYDVQTGALGSTEGTTWWDFGNL